MTDDGIIDGLIRREGGFVDHPTDRSGPTKFGITARALGEARGLDRAATAEEVNALTESEARAIYRRLYIDKPGFTGIADAPLRALLIDGAVHSGPTRAVEWLQCSLGVAADGRIGPVTLAALEVAGADHVRRRVLAERIRFLGRLITRDPSQAAFARGWLDRVADFAEA
jgi:lysozyme family protein